MVLRKAKRMKASRHQADVVVIPAQAGIQMALRTLKYSWIPACAGMTKLRFVSPLEASKPRSLDSSMP
jgi:hypothetical protein